MALDWAATPARGEFSLSAEQLSGGGKKEREKRIGNETPEAGS